VKNKRSQWKTRKQCCGWWCCGGAATAIPLMARQQLMKRPCWGLTQPRQQRQLKPNCPADAILADGRARAQSNNDTKKKTYTARACANPGIPCTKHTPCVCVLNIAHMEIFSYIWEQRSSLMGGAYFVIFGPLARLSNPPPPQRQKKKREKKENIKEKTSKYT
jgi:hypothetical protein